MKTMKNLILTIALVTTSLISFGQVGGATRTINFSTSSTCTEEVTVKWENTQNVVFDTITLEKDVVFEVDVKQNTKIRKNITSPSVLDNAISEWKLTETGNYLLVSNYNDGDLFIIVIVVVEEVDNACGFIKGSLPAVVGLFENKKEDISLKVYPNPVSDLATVSFNSNSNLDIEVYSLNGQLMFTENNLFSGSNEVKINMNDFPKGMYLVKVGTSTFRIIKE